MPFWYDKGLDRTNGGYIDQLRHCGQAASEPVTKMIVTQARQVWLFSRLARAGYEPKEAGGRRPRLPVPHRKMWDPGRRVLLGGGRHRQPEAQVE